MSSNVGLSTPRGSGTSGYVQRNLSHLKPREQFAPYPKDFDTIKEHRKKADHKILAHNKAREVEVEVFELRDKLEDEGVDEDEIEERCEALRKKLTTASEKINGTKSNAKGLKSHQVHELEVAKNEESEKLRKALGIRSDYEEGSHWKKQEDRLRDSVAGDEGAKRRDGPR
jgi:hypothetical protein